MSEPELDRDDWRDIAAACQYAVDHVWPQDERRAEWLRLRNIAVEKAALFDLLKAREFALTGGMVT